MWIELVRARIAQSMGDKLRTQRGTSNTNKQIILKRTAFAADFSSVNLRGEVFDPFDSFFDFLANFRCWRERGIPQPIVPDHSIFIGIGNRAFSNAAMSASAFCARDSMPAKNLSV